VPVTTVIFGVLLIGLSLWGWSASTAEHPSPTTWIPAGFGVPLVVLGLLALKESLLKHAMHLAAALGLLGLLGAGGRLLATLVRTGRVEGHAGISVALMTLLCAVFVALCVNSFLAARRRRRSAAGQP